MYLLALNIILKAIKLEGEWGDRRLFYLA